jgi:RsiW-degrading membrane proteinase PrsW (M82 family)
MSIGMTGKDFRFSRKDIIFFTFSVVLGFIFIENILYFFSWILPVWQWIFRSIFTMIIHIFAATICAHFWWKALSYKLFSFRYFIVFFSGFVLAAMVHMLYNLSLQTGNIMVVIVFAIIGYMMFTRLIVKE